jgi:hypothetical protein
VEEDGREKDTATPLEALRNLPPVVGVLRGFRRNQKREGNERVTWTTVVGFCFIDRTWRRIT